MAVDGLQSTMTDALIRIAYLDGTTEVVRLKADMPSHVVIGAQTSLDVAATYFWLGVDHILSRPRSSAVRSRADAADLRSLDPGEDHHRIYTGSQPDLGQRNTGVFQPAAGAGGATIALSIAFVASGS